MSLLEIAFYCLSNKREVFFKTSVQLRMCYVAGSGDVLVGEKMHLLTSGN